MFPDSSFEERRKILFELLDLSAPITILWHLSHTVDLLLQEMLPSNASNGELLSRHLRSPLTFCSQLSPCLEVVMLRDLNLGSKVEALCATI